MPRELLLGGGSNTRARPQSASGLRHAMEIHRSLSQKGCHLGGHWGGIIEVRFNPGHSCCLDRLTRD
jgi:hypothetical protein